MRVSKLFTKTSKTAPADEVAKNAQLLIRAGFVNKEMAGVYDYLPLGKVVLNKIIDIIREEMDGIGGNEVSLTALQQKDSWEASGRWDDQVMDVWFKTKLASGSELGLAPTHEEPLTKLMKSFINSYKDLPVYPYQFQIKFRNELRSKSGLMRGREFWMKDLYSFSRTQEEHDAFYEVISEAYDRVYARLGLGDFTYKTFASGGSFAKYSHEFQTLSPVGEDKIYVHRAKKIAINEEVYNDEVLADLGISKDELVEESAVEVGNIFTLGTKFSDALDLNYTDEDGISKRVIMGSYGIGPSRVMGLIAEHFSDDKGLVWPENVAPAKVYLVRIGAEQAIAHADELYDELTAKGVDVLYDDRDERPGTKFADAELMGIPYRVTVSDRLIAAGQYEFLPRTGGEMALLTRDELLDKLN
ncbi:MAG TPA: aminoacyl--tRNA ligase-related protein, partial [Candidatus Saccharimonadales bacterium]|jgi:prolyl-tRNA synthetase|nr:aminoacyl--tRNA ligase-related protein [Candidatus Saccharimonadales bacterium]